MSNPFDRLRVNPYVKSYVGSPIEELRTSLGALQKRHDTGLATMDQLARAYGKIKAVKGDQPYIDAYGQQLRKDIEEYSQAPEHATAGIMSMARDFALDPGLQRAQKTYADYMADVQKANEMGLSDFQRQKMTDAINAYTAAGGAESLQQYNRIPFYEELNMQEEADKALKGIQEVVDKGAFDEEGNLQGPAFYDEKGNIIQLKRGQITPERVRAIAASSLLQDPKTLRELRDRFRYNKQRSPESMEELYEWTRTKFVEPLVAKYATTDLEYSIKTPKGSSSGSGNTGGLGGGIPLQYQGASYITDSPFNVDEFEHYGSAGQYVAGLIEEVENLDQLPTPMDQYKKVNEINATTNAIRDALIKSPFTEGQRNIIRQMTDEELRGLFAQERDETSEIFNAMEFIDTLIDSGIITEENYQLELKKAFTKTGAYAPENHYGIPTTAGQDAKLAAGRFEGKVAPTTELSSSALNYLLELANASPSLDAFVQSTLEAQYPQHYDTGAQFDWSQVGNLLRDKYGLSEEDAKEMQVAFERNTDKSIWRNNLEDYLTDDRIMDIAVTPQFTHPGSVYQKEVSGRMTEDPTVINQLNDLFRQQFAVGVNEKMRSGFMRTINDKGQLVDFADVFDDLGGIGGGLNWTKAEIVGVGGINAPGMYEIMVPATSAEKGFDNEAKMARFPVMFTDRAMTNIDAFTADAAARRLKGNLTSDQENEYAAIYIAHSHAQEVANALDIANRNKTANTDLRLNFPGVDAVEEALNVDAIIPRLDRSGLYSFEDEDGNNILNERYQDINTAMFTLFHKFYDNLRIKANS